MSRVHLVCFLVLIMEQALAKPPGPGGPDDIGEEPVCRKGKMSEFIDERCCGEESYIAGYVTALLKHYKDCAVEPKDTTLNASECQWLFYDCLVEKSLASNEITPITYVDMMAGSLADSKKAAILEIMQKQAVTDDSDSIPKSRKLWSQYFAAEADVCNEKSDKVVKRGPMIPFKSGAAPAILFLPMTLRSGFLCQRKFQEKYSDKSRNVTMALLPLCALTISGTLTDSDLTSPLDYEKFLNLMMPKYLSQSAKENLTKAMTAELKIEFPSLGDSPTGADITKAITERYKDEVEAMPDSEADKTFFMNGFIAFHEVMAAAKSFKGGKMNDF
ncbi:unnamed protein product [Allacma fusca]|uniref:Uncharacterized protein n=3 Tax=Allacma fusca TaxID=39272 RepID=A0A8J2LEF2_9HEXA|nr:unnamed protein product [Allacma fusca]CAG7833643.1 unnamed protein product [Allacma fusca]